jgi:hypothetical protein
VTGIFEFTFDVALVSTFPSGTVVYCEADVTATSEFNGSTTTLPFVSDYTEVGVGHVNASGKSVTCATNIPYSWEVAPATLKPTNVYNVHYEVIAVLPTTTSTGTVLANEGVLRETASELVLSLPIPASGTTTKRTMSVEI